MSSLFENCSLDSYKAIHSLCKRKSGFLLRWGVIVVALLFVAQAGYGVTYYSRATGNWSSVSTWSTTFGGGAGTVIPTSADVVVICGGYTVTVDVTNAVAASVQVSGTSATISGTGTLIFNASSQLTVSGGVILGNSVTRYGTITMTSGGTLNCQSLRSNSASDTFTEGAGTVVLTATNTLASTDTGAEFTNFNNLTISAGTTTLARNTTIAGNLTISSGAVLNLSTFTANRSTSGGTLTVAGTMQLGTNTGGQTGSNFPANYSTVTLTGGTVEYSSAGAQTIYGINYNNLTLSGTSAKTLQSGTTNIGGNLTLTGTATTTTVAGLTISGNLIIGSGTTFTANAGSALTVNGTTAIGNSSGAGGSGTFTISAYNSSPVLKGSVTIYSGGTWSNSATNSPVNFQGGITNNGTFTPGTGPITFDTNAQILGGTISFSTASVTITGINLTNNSTLTTNGTISGTGALINSIGSNATLNGAVSVVTLTNAGTMAISGSATPTTLTNQGTLTFSGSSYENPTTLTNQGTLTITTSGGFGTAIANFTNVGTLHLGGSGYITGLTNNAAGIANLTSTSQQIGTFNNATSNSTLNISALTYTINTLTVIANGNTVNYNGLGAQAIKNISYSNLTLSGSGTKTFSAATTIGNNFSISSKADLGAGYVHTAGTLILGGTTQVSSTYGGTGSLATNINTTYFANNTGIVSLINTWTGATSTDWNTPSNWSKGAVPTASDDAFISNVATQPVIGVSAVCNNLTIYTGSSVTISGSNTLSVSGNLVNGGTFTCNSGTLSVATSFTNSGTFNNNTGILLITGNFTSTGTFNYNTGTVIYNGTAQTVAGISYYNLTLSGSGVKTLQVGTTNIYGNLTLNGTASSTTVAGLTVAGNLLIGDGTIFNAAGFTLTVTGTTTVGGGASGILNITSATATKTFTGDVTLNSGSIWNESAASVLNFAGNLTNYAATFTASSGVHTFSGSSKTLSGSTVIAIPSASFTGSYTNSSVLTCSTLLSVSNTTLTNNGTITATTALSNGASNGTLTQGANAILNVGGTVGINTLTANVSHNTVCYNGGSQNIKLTTYDYLVLQGSGSPNIKTFQTGTTTINSLLSVEGTATATLTGTITYGASAILQYKGSLAQTTGNEFPASFAGTGGVIIDNSFGVTLGAVKAIGSASKLILTNGILTTTATNYLTINNTATTSISGGSSTSYINGPVRWLLPASLASGSSYTFPVGNTAYLPCVLVNPTTGVTGPTMQVQAFNGSFLGRTFDATALSSISTTEYWALSVASGNFTNSSVSLGRAAVTPNDAIAGSTAAAGSYNLLNGSPSVSLVSNSSTIGSNRYFVLAKAIPGLFTSVSSLTGFTYKERLGPSTNQTFTVRGAGLTDNIKLEALKDANYLDCYELSTDNVTFSSIVTLPVVNGTVSTTTIYVRQKAGLVMGSYTANISITSSGQTTKTVSCSGNVTQGAVLLATPASLSAFTYKFAAGPSAVQSFIPTGTNLSGQITVTPPADYEVSSDATTYYSTAITCNSGATISVRLKAGLGVGTYGENIVLSAAGAIPVNVLCSGIITAAATLTTSTSFLGGFLYASGTTLANSPVQSFQIYGSDLTANVVVTSTSTNFLISSTEAGSYTNTITLTASGSFTTTIYVKMAAGLTATNIFGPNAITITSAGAVPKGIGCTGKVVAASTASLYTSVATLTGFGYQFSTDNIYNGVMDGGPSSPQSFVLSGVSLSSDVTVTPTANFEVSTSSTGSYSSSLTVPRTGSTVLPTKIYVRLVSGKSVGTYTGSVGLNAGPTATVSLASASVYASPLIRATGGGDYCIGNTINLGGKGADIESRYWTGPNSYYSTLDTLQLTTSATASMSGNYIVTGNVTAGGNLIYNGNFEMGDIAVGSAYIYRDSTYINSADAAGTGTKLYGALYNEGNYAIVANPHNVHINFTTNGDHSTVGSKQMVINGAATAGSVIWSQSVAVLTNSDYQFTYWLQSVNSVSPSKLQLYINGVAAGPIYNATSTTGVWGQYLYNASSGSNTLLNLELVNQNTDPGGNDFALDDIEFKQVLSAKDTAVVAVSASLPVSVTVTASQNPVNAGIPVTYTATPVNGGLAPTYQWYVNNILVSGATASSYTYSPANGDLVKCVLTSSLACKTGSPATSTVITMTVNAVVNPNYWIGTVSTDWSNVNNWTDARIPVAGADVEYATNTNNSNKPAVNDLYVDNERTIGSLINATTKRLVIPAGKRLIVNNTITTDGSVDRIYIQSSSTLPTGSLIFHNAQNYPVYATVEMYSKASIDKLTNPANSSTWYSWQYFGIPVESASAVTTFTGSYVRRWYEPGTTKSNHWIQLSNDSTLSPFYGYELCQPTPKTFIFTGKLINKDFSTTLGYSYYGAGNAQNALFPGQHIFANPYTAAIDIKQLTFGTETEKSVYMYNTGSFSQWGGGQPDDTAVGKTTAGNNPGQYTSATVNTAGSNSIPRQIPSMQAILIKAMSSSVNATFGIVYNSAVVSDTTMQRAPSVIDQPSSTQVSTLIDVNGKNAGDRMWVFSDPQCTKKFDNGWDAAKILGSSLTPQLYAIESDGNYQVNAVDDINDTQLAFMAGSDVEYKMTFTHENTKLYYPGIYLVDVVENKVVDITESGSSYSFLAESTPSPVNRFKIVTRHYEKNASDESSELKIFSANGMIFVHNFSSLKGDAMIYDISGHYIRKIQFAANGITEISSNLVAGAYVVKCMTEKEDIAKRVIVR